MTFARARLGPAAGAVLPGRRKPGGGGAMTFARARLGPAAGAVLPETE